MPTARELLEQADALMRRNRNRGDADFPILTEAVAAAQAPLQLSSADIPVLTERVEEVVVDIPPLPPPEPAPPIAALMEGDPSDWLVMDTIDPALHSVTGKAPDTLAVIPPVTMKTQPQPPPMAVEPPPTRVTLKAAGSAPTPPPAGSEMPDGVPTIAAAGAGVTPADTAGDPLDAASDERWAALAEQISMQVLQRLDVFTDTGLKDQLARHLQPIVDRASAELVSGISEQLGKLVRSYVAEAIEREIAQWRNDHR
jgi:hypothetical protein